MITLTDVATGIVSQYPGSLGDPGYVGAAMASHAAASAAYVDPGAAAGAAAAAQQMAADKIAAQVPVTTPMPTVVQPALAPSEMVQVFDKFKALSTGKKVGIAAGVAAVGGFLLFGRK
jgi:hypothetical protein